MSEEVQSRRDSSRILGQIKPCQGRAAYPKETGAKLLSWKMQINTVSVKSRKEGKSESISQGNITSGGGSCKILQFQRKEFSKISKMRQSFANPTEEGYMEIVQQTKVD